MTTIIDYKNPVFNRASNIYTDHGASLIGRYVLTEPLHNWEGGFCVITKINPDVNAPEIVFNANRLSNGEEIGMFEWEYLWLFETRKVDLNTLAMEAQ